MIYLDFNKNFQLPSREHIQLFIKNSEKSEEEIAGILLAGHKAREENRRKTIKPQSHYDFCNNVHMKY